MSEDRFPQTVIDDSNRHLFNLCKSEADNHFDGEVNEELVYQLVKEGRMIRFSHDFINNKLYIDFPKISSELIKYH